MSKFNKVLSVFLALLCLGVFNLAQARTGVGHGGGGEWHVIKCVSSMQNNQKLSLNVCLTGETNRQGKYELIPCGRDSSPFVTIQRFTGVAVDSRVIETIKIPGRLFSIDWTEVGFFLRVDDPIAGKLSLIRLGSPDQDKGNSGPQFFLNEIQS